MTSKSKSVLIVDTDSAVRDRFAAIVEPEFRALRAVSGEAALHTLVHEDVDIVCMNVCLPGISGLELLRIVRENYPLVENLMVSEVGEVEIAVQAIKDGAYHFVTADIDEDTLRSLLRHASERQDLNRRVLTLSAEVAQSEREFVVGPSTATRDIVDLVQRVAKLSATVLILGESGTGKELLARLIHRTSERPEAPFVTVNLAAIPRELVESTLFGHEKGAFTGAVRQQIGKFELAGDGTLFLDEIGDLRVDLQAKILRTLQERQVDRVGGSHPIAVDARVIAATNKDIERAVKEGGFREDLYYRLSVITLHMPPLRERREDIPLLVSHFLKKFSAGAALRIAAEALSTMKTYGWPGNVRELENVIERASVLKRGEVITVADLPDNLKKEKADVGNIILNLPDEGISLEDLEKNLIVKALEKHKGNQTRAADYLGITRPTLIYRMEKYGIR
jgi:DNA-binding NtrC family response regulator